VAPIGGRGTDFPDRRDGRDAEEGLCFVGVRAKVGWVKVRWVMKLAWVEVGVWQREQRSVVVDVARPPKLRVRR
jgi:hypothetical protein